MKTRAAVLTGIKKPLEVLEIEVPELKEGQVLVKIVAAGVCRTQINEWQGLKGEDKYLPHLLGHEASAVVERVGVGVNKVKVGDYVVVSWIKGDGMDVGGGIYTDNEGRKINSGPAAVFTEYAVVSENRVVVIDNDVRPEVAALFGCAVPTGVGVVTNTLKAKNGQSIAIFGVGGVGAAAILGAVYAGCDPIIAVDVKPAALELAMKLGATQAINVVEASDLAVDLAVEASGVPAVATQAFEALTNSGTLAIAGHPAQGLVVSFDPFGFIQGKKVVGTWGGDVEPDKDIPKLVDLYKQGRLPADLLISRVYSLEEINQVLDDLVENRIIRAVLRFF